MRLYRLVALVSFLLLFASGASTQENLIHGCIKKNGTLKIVSVPANCASGDTPISWNQAKSTSPLRVFDGNGRDLGASNPIFGVSRYGVLLEDLGVTILIDRSTGESYSWNVIYELPLCEGQGYVDSFLSNVVFSNAFYPDSLFIGSTSEYLLRHDHQSVASHQSGTCDPQAGNEISVVRVEEFTQDLGLTFPVPLPLWIGVRDDSP